jgi:hypothetical protein
MEHGKFTLEEIIQLTSQKEEGWAVAHAQRLLELIREIGAELPYDNPVLEMAAYTHDWGAFPDCFQEDVDHALRSRQVVELEIVPRLDLTTTQKKACSKPSNYTTTAICVHPIAGSAVAARSRYA